MTTKKCASVHHTGDVETDVALFSKRATSSDGLNSWCKACCKIDSRIRREAAAAATGKELKVNRPRGSPKVRQGRYVPTSIEMKMKQQLQAVRRRCKKNGIPFSITVADLLPLPTHCPDLGLELNYFTNQGYFPNRATVDKIVPALGYIPGNVRVVSNQANVMKQDATPEQLKRIALRWLELVENMT